MTLDSCNPAWLGGAVYRLWKHKTVHKCNKRMAIYMELNCTLQAATDTDADMETGPGIRVGFPQPDVQNFETVAP